MTLRARLRAGWQLWLEAMNRQRITRDGWFYLAFTLVVGVAAINTGNNLLYLVLGLQLSLVLLSGFLSESTLRALVVERRLPPHATAGEAFEVRLGLRNEKPRVASFSLTLTEMDGPAAGAQVFLARVPAATQLFGAYRTALPARGEAPFGRVRITTTFPFGLFEKSREQRLDELLALEPARRPAPTVRAGQARGDGERPEPRPGQGREFHSLRDFRSGDDPREVHWRTSARAGKLVAIEREKEKRRRVTLLFDTRGLQPAQVDGGAEAAAALARRWVEAGWEVGLSTPGETLPPATGVGGLRRLLPALARLRPALPSIAAPRTPPGSQPIVVPLLVAKPPGAPRIEALPPPAAAGVAGRLTLAGVQRLTVWLAAALAFVSVALSGELPLWTHLCVALSALVGLRGREAPSATTRLLANVAVLVALAASIALVVTGQLEIYVAGPTFVVCLAATRLASRGGVADDPLLLLSSLLMLAGGAALTGDLWYGLVFVGFAVVSTIALCLTFLRRSLEEVVGREATERRGTVGGGLISALALLSLTALVGSLAVFVAFPRISTGLLARAARDRAGVSEQIELGGSGFLKLDPTPVMRVRWDPARRPGGDVYWRTITFDAWDGRAWRRTPSETKLIDRVPLEPPPPVAERLAATVEATLDTAGLPVPPHAWTVRVVRRPGLAQARLFSRPDGTFEVKSPDEEIEYEVGVARRPPEARLRAAEASVPPELQRFTVLPPETDPRVAALAATFAPGGDRLDVVLAAERHFLTGFRYSRELPGAVADPLVDFLFERREGHCEYYASSLAVLLRARGIPARVAAGYYGGAPVEEEAWSLVRRGDAHAWTEVHFPGVGWVGFDATPAEDRTVATGGVRARLLARLDEARALWRRWVLDFSGSEQLTLAAAIAQAVAPRAGAGRSLGRLAIGAGVLVLSILLALLLPRLLRRLRRPGPPPEHRAIVALYREARHALGRQGVTLPPGATPDEWSRAATALPAAREAIELYEAVRFGGATAEASRLAALRASLARDR